MTDFGARPPHVAADAHFGPWFAAVAARVLNAADLLVAGEPHRIAELEAYYHGDAHADAFTHRDPVQYQPGRWYFHRTGGAYRGGSFKGVDLTAGDGTSMFGVLVRTVVAPDGTVIDGPSRTVDHLLARTGRTTVAALDAAIAGRRVWDASSPLSLRERPTPRTDAVYATARVGLSLKRGRGNPAFARFVMRPYRYLTEPRRIRQGRPQLVLALHQQGHGAAAIHALTGVPLKTIARYVADYEEGRQETSFAGYEGRELSTAELCRLMGTWAAKYGSR